ncbi:class I SAM-dependent methyltransferase [Nonomuraea typhae]|uniref:class I SAM-dependent methyltransferase n=1 Tax=Nonomuraea typhae TaxID=2603600 RepID=UPI001C67C191|nr:class I SAM-dependent methyltransferase [Nonomuraea typhae]
MTEVWAAGAAYEAFMGRWAGRMASVFVPGLGVPAGGRWLDVGCGTGALTAAVLSLADPREVTGIDPSAGFLAHARARVAGPRVTFCTGDAGALPYPGAWFDAVVSGLVLNFLPDPARAAAELARVAAPGGVVAAYVWDYADGMAMLRHFWDAAATLDPAAAALDEGARFPLCRPEPLRALWAGAGLTGVRTEPIVVPMEFTGFDDFWTPFLGGQGPAPGYVASLPGDHRAALRDLLRERLPASPFSLTARAWAVYGRQGR